MKPCPFQIQMYDLVPPDETRRIHMVTVESPRILNRILRVICELCLVGKHLLMEPTQFYFTLQMKVIPGRKM